MDGTVVLPPPARLRRSNTFSPAAPIGIAPRVQDAAWDDHAVASSVQLVRRESTEFVFAVKPRDDREQSDATDNQRESHETDEHEHSDATDGENDESSPANQNHKPTSMLRRKVTIFETPVQMLASANVQRRDTRRPLRRNSADARCLEPMARASPGSSNASSSNNQHSAVHRYNSHTNTTASKLSNAQKRGCFQYIKRRHSIAMAFASAGSASSNGSNNYANGSSTIDDHLRGDALGGEELGSHWEYVKSKHGVEIFKSTRSRCEIRGVTRVNASVKNVMSLLAAGESTESFAHAQNILLGRDQVLEARVLASCVPSSASRYFHCGLKYMAIKNPFGLHPLDVVFLDYTDVSTTPDDKLIGYRILESIRVPEFRSVTKYIRASIRCEVYIVRETDVPGVVEVSFASHLDPKSKYFASKRHTWLDQIVVRLTNLRSYAEKASFSHRLLLEKGKLVKGEARPHCSICETGFSFLRKRHNCRLCGEVTCGRCSRKLPVFVGTETTRVRVCLGCMIQSRRQPDELGRLDVVQGRRNSIGNATYIAYDEIEDVCDDEHDE